MLGSQAYQCPSSNPRWNSLSFFCWSTIWLTRPHKGRHCSDCWPCNVCTFRDAGHVSWTDSLQIPESHCCRPLFDNWLSDPDHVYTHGSGNASCQVSSKHDCDYRKASTSSVVAVWAKPEIRDSYWSAWQRPYRCLPCGVQSEPAPTPLMSRPHTPVVVLCQELE
jgi:hypothetical protein